MPISTSRIGAAAGPAFGRAYRIHLPASPDGTSSRGGLHSASSAEVQHRLGHGVAHSSGDIEDEPLQDDMRLQS
jgi:hypothetical protein